MAEAVSYRLMDYKITEYPGGYLAWETHCGFGSFKRGGCFINGDILFIEFSDREENGFLKGEYLDHLASLPKWEKTRCFCSGCGIYDCETGKKVTAQKLADRFYPGGPDPKSGVEKKSAKRPGSEEGVFCLPGRREIVEKNDGRLFWASHGGRDVLNGGKCFINGDILFIGPLETRKTGVDKKQFVRRLSRLPKWTGTGFYCVRYSLYSCEDGSICRDLNDARQAKKPALRMLENKRSQGRSELEKRRVFDNERMVRVAEMMKNAGLWTWTTCKDRLLRKRK